MLGAIMTLVVWHEGLAHPTHLWSSQHLGNSAQVLRGGGPLLVVHGAGVAPHHSIWPFAMLGAIMTLVVP